MCSGGLFIEKQGPLCTLTVGHQWYITSKLGWLSAMDVFEMLREHYLVYFDWLVCFSCVSLAWWLIAEPETAVCVYQCRGFVCLFFINDFSLHCWHKFHIRHKTLFNGQTLTTCTYIHTVLTRQGFSPLKSLTHTLLQLLCEHDNIKRYKTGYRLLIQRICSPFCVMLHQ